ncbi:MAG: MmcQ/YjbR family DNA-binding protein [Chloroflexota bacterium]
MTSESRDALAAIREFALGLPEAYEEFPWGERVAKVNKKIFVFLGIDDERDENLAFSVKLPISNEDALNFPFTKPSGYNLGKSGWVKVSLFSSEPLPVDLFLRWVEESYRAIAPKKLIAQLKSVQHPHDL